MPLIGWVDDTTVTGDEWPDFESIDAPTRTRLLGGAYEQLVLYAPALDPAAAVIPDRYRLAQILQAQENWNATRREGDVVGFGEEGYAIRVRPLSTTVKSLLRPKSFGAGQVG